MADRLVELLAGAKKRWVDDRLNHFGTGTKLEAVVWVEHVAATVSIDQASEGVGHVEKFVVKGRWVARVRKDKYQIGRLYDKLWGDNNQPYGFFIINVKALDGEVAGSAEVEVTVEDQHLEPQKYALKYANELIREKIAGAVVQADQGQAC